MKHSYLISVLDYNPVLGTFHWKWCQDKSNLWNSKYSGKAAGSVFTSQHGMKYLRIKLDQKNYLAHRLAWFIMRRTWPIQIDHWDTDGLNNKWDNIRACTQSQNFANRGCPLRGIDPFPNGKWRAKISVDGQQIHLGMFSSQEEAYAIYKQALIDVHGDFAIYNRR